MVHGCILIIPQAARTSSNLVVSLFLFSSLLLEPRCTTEMRRNKNRRRTDGTAHRFSPLNRVRWLQHRFAQTPDRFSLRSSPASFPLSVVFSAGFLLLQFTSPRVRLVLYPTFGLAFIIDALRLFALWLHYGIFYQKNV